MLQITVSRRQLVVFTAVVAMVVSVAWIGVAQRVSAASATPVVYVATGENFPDALGAASAAAVQGGPVLLVTKTAIPPETAAELTRLSPDVIYVAGGTAVVSDTVFNALKAYAGSVVRVAGPNRYSTAVEVSKSAFPVTLAGGGDTAALEAAVAALTARLDAFEASGKAADSDLLDGKDSIAFATSGHDHDADYLAKTGKATDSDKLDGKDSTAFLPNGTPPVGTTARGNYALGNQSRTAFDSIGWGFEMPSDPTPHIRKAGSAPTTECPGTPADPQALEGHLCLYESSSYNLGLVYVFPGSGGPSWTADAFGASIYGENAGDVEFSTYGTWAVTVGTP